MLRAKRISLLVAAMIVAGVASAQVAAIKRTLLQRADLGDGREAILGMAEIPGAGATGRHTHFGIETGYVAEGTMTLEIEGEAARNLKAGDSYTIPAGRIHNATATGGGAKVIATYIVDKDKPLATPAP
jgi:quercetin dioxygenase-like cupin family protein